jgi:cytochrome c oxidase subunit IV
MYFMHLKYERKTLTWIALSPFILCVFLILMLIPGLS